MTRVPTIPSRRRKTPAALILAATLGAPAAAKAQANAEAPTATFDVPATTTPTVAAPAAPPAPYSLPWQLRPAVVGTVLRSDSSYARYEAGGNSGSTVASLFLASYKITPTLAPLVRLGVVRNQEPGPTLGAGSAFLNPILGLTYGRKLGSDFRLAIFGGAALPVGTGGDKSPMADERAAALGKGILARSAMDNAMFAVNYFTPLGGVDLAWVAHKTTVQAEVTVLQLLRVRNEMFAAEEARTNFTAGLHVGHFAAKFLSLGAELRYQRWLTTPMSVKATPTTRETVTVAFGPRFHIPLGDGRFLRPGLSYARGLDKPLEDRKYHMVQLDLPLAL